MPNFLFVYYGGKMATTPEEQKKSMDEWTKWFKDQGQSLKDMGAPTMPGKLIVGSSIKSIGRNPVTGYSIFQADNVDTAIAIAKTSPQIKDGGQIAVYQAMPM